MRQEFKQIYDLLLEQQTTDSKRLGAENKEIVTGVETDIKTDKEVVIA